MEIFYMDNNFFVFKVEDWITLRKTHRIIGKIIGETTIPSLPLRLYPEEVLLLLHKNLVQINEVEMKIEPEHEKKRVEKYQDELLKEQQVLYKENRKIQLESIIEQIMLKRREAGDNRGKDEILNEELEKSSLVTKETMIWPIFLESNFPLITKRILTFQDILYLTSNLKFQIYKDLYDKGYFITPGEKFGGDFLVYLGDPICYHSIFIIKCIEDNMTIFPTEIIAFGRLGTAVRKRAVLASIVDNKVCYVTIKWIDA